MSHPHHSAVRKFFPVKVPPRSTGLIRYHLHLIAPTYGKLRKKILARSAIPWTSGVRELEEPAIGCHNLLPLTLTTCHSLLQTPSPRQPIATYGRLSQAIAGKINIPPRLLGAPASRPRVPISPLR